MYSIIVIMKLVVGLGNIGNRYAQTRHNVGFMVIEQLAKSLSDSSSLRWQAKFVGMTWQVGNLLLLKPSTFMNESGKSVREAVNFYKIKNEDVYVIYDDLDISLGQYKIQFDKGPKVHNGLASVRESLGTNAFWHARVGVENRQIKGNSGVPGVEYSLHSFTKEERLVVERVILEVVDELLAVVS